MNWNKLTAEFKIYIGVIAATIGYLLVSVLQKDDLTVFEMGILFVMSIVGLIVALKDERTRPEKAASGYWALGAILWLPLTIVYPIAVSIKERSFNSIFWFILTALFAPTIVITFGAVFLGIDIK